MKITRIAVDFATSVSQQRHAAVMSESHPRDAMIDPAVIRSRRSIEANAATADGNPENSLHRRCRQSVGCT